MRFWSFPKTGKRRRLPLRVEHLESRYTPSVSAVAIPLSPGHPSAGFQLQILGDNNADTINILDQGNGEVTVTDGSGKVFRAPSTVSRHSFRRSQWCRHRQLHAAAHADDQRIHLHGSRQRRSGWRYARFLRWVSNATLVVCVNGSPNDDHISASVGAVSNAHLTFFLNGGAGDDSLSFGVAADIDARSSVTAILNGGTGNDQVYSAFTGSVFGSLNFGVYGGDGNDTVNLNTEIEEGSTGVAYAYASGGAGTDDVTLYFDDYSFDKVSSSLKSWRATIVDPSPATTTIHDTSNNVTVTTR